MRKLHIQYIRDAKGMRVIVPWQPAGYQWPIWGIVAAAFSSYWAVIGGWELALLCAPVSAYGAAAIAFNRREIRLGSGGVEWLSTPWRVGLKRQILTAEIAGWVHGPSPNRADPSAPYSEAKIHAAGMKLKDGSIIRFADRMPDLGQTKELADKCAEFTGMRSEFHETMRGTEKVGKTWIDWAEWIFIGMSILVFLWKLRD